MKNFLTIKDLGRAGMYELIRQASELRDALDRNEQPPQSLQGKCVANLFFEPSTRTQLSFDLAAQRLGANVITFDAATSSTSKGESLRDTVLTVSAIGADILVVRHVDEGAPQLVADWTGLGVVNAGDGVNEHPTQALLDLVTIHRHFGDFESLRVGIVGDIAHSRVAGSLVHALPKLGAEITLVAPRSWLPRDSAHPTFDKLDPVLSDLDVVYVLRVQTERGARFTDSYISDLQLDSERLGRMREDAVVMHAGPMNRGVEITDQVADSSRTLVTEQVRNGVPTRMAVLRNIGGDR
ncbi:MAG TPA: aspartate carbamoyltransferase catalytic subunit [Acidimicrobiia bacterium]|nr:aspartate carbamoyltransferase catalytic subunit [Acidimicrobiia bacterium]